MSDWNGIERRHRHRKDEPDPTNSDLMGLIEQVSDNLTEHIAEERPILTKLLEAFINGDFQRHREEHTALAAIIANQKAQEQFWRTLMARAAETGLLGLLKLIGWLILIGIGTALSLKFNWIGPK